MFERFTIMAQKCIALATCRAKEHNHEYVGTEHVLLAIAKEGEKKDENAAFEVLSKLGVDFEKVHQQFKETILPGEEPVIKRELPQTPRCKAMIKHAIKEAKELNRECVTTVDLLLGMFQATESIASQILEIIGIKSEDVRKTIGKVSKALASETNIASKVEIK